MFNIVRSKIILFICQESEGGDGAAKEKTAEAKKKGNLTRGINKGSLIFL